jgi:hypothetical protein
MPGLPCVAGQLHLAQVSDSTCCSDGGVRLSNARTGQQVAVLAGHADAVAAVAFSPEGELVATGSEDGAARLWDQYTGRELAVFPVADARVEPVAFRCDGRRLAAGGRRDGQPAPDLEDRTALGAVPGSLRPGVRGGLSRQEWAQYLPGEPYQNVCPKPDNS